MKNIAYIIAALVVGVLIGDYFAYHMAKEHGVQKYGGVFSRQPRAGKNN